MISITIPGKPIAQARPRFARRGKFVTTYNPQETEAGRFMLLVKAQLPEGWEPFRGGVSIRMKFYIPRPKNHYGSGKNALTLKPNAPLLHTSKPDIDNLEKMVYDCLNRVVWVDDSCICDSAAIKEYSDNPRTEITIEEVV